MMSGSHCEVECRKPAVVEEKADQFVIHILYIKCKNSEVLCDQFPLWYSADLHFLKSDTGLHCEIIWDY